MSFLTQLAVYFKGDMKRKRIIGIVVACIMVILFARCGKSSNEHVGEAKNPSVQFIKKVKITMGYR
ncbi:hypothetical protein JR334_00155 [Clostridia bacterium]|nr:hypothetical protein JR334_00155 [Clostridia bacterium]